MIVQNILVQTHHPNTLFAAERVALYLEERENKNKVKKKKQVKKTNQKEKNKKVKKQDVRILKSDRIILNY